jgi:hypothetical protein
MGNTIVSPSPARAGAAVTHRAPPTQTAGNQCSREPKYLRPEGQSTDQMMTVTLPTLFRSGMRISSDLTRGRYLVE